MYEQAEAFFAEVTDVFRFLEQRYDCQRQEGFIAEPNDGRDATAKLRYLSSHIGVTIGWYFVGASVDVSFIELVQPRVFPRTAAAFGYHLNPPRQINLYTLAEVLGDRDDPDFLLIPRAKRGYLKKNTKTIETRMHDVLTGLAHATQTYAASILEGDTSIFPEVMRHYTQEMIKIYGDQPAFH